MNNFKDVDGHEAYEFDPLEESASIAKSKQFYLAMCQRRSVRFFDDKPVTKEVIHNVLMTASTAPSGANKQPWSFAAVCTPDVKDKIREAAEKEEYRNYHGRMSDEWLEDLEKFGTEWHKPFLTTAPWLIVVFKQTYELREDGSRGKNYYVNESVGIAAGLLIAAIHNAGLVTLTHTPSPMNFLEKVLERPVNEKAFLLLPVGYPAKDATVPIISRKTGDDVISYY